MRRRGGGHACPVVFVCVWRPSWRRLLLYVAGPCLEVSNKLLFCFASPYNPVLPACFYLTHGRLRRCLCAYLLVSETGETTVDVA